MLRAPDLTLRAWSYCCPGTPEQHPRSTIRTLQSSRWGPIQACQSLERALLFLSTQLWQRRTHRQLASREGVFCWRTTCVRNRRWRQLKICLIVGGSRQWRNGSGLHQSRCRTPCAPPRGHQPAPTCHANRARPLKHSEDRPAENIRRIFLSSTDALA